MGQFGEENTEFRASRKQKEGIEYLWGQEEGSRERRSQWYNRTALNEA